MLRKHHIRQYGVIGLFLFLFLTYLFFPWLYRSVSEQLFSFVYTYEHPTTLFDAPESVFEEEEDIVVPLFVLARPPQTPYDFFITTADTVSEYSEGAAYVYTETGVPIGYIHEKMKQTYRIALFSSPVSEEIFSVNNYTTAGTGIGGGSFVLSIPRDIVVSVGMPVVHQITGKIAGTVLSIKDVPENNIQTVTSTITHSPVQISVVYIHTMGVEHITDESIDTAVRETEGLLDVQTEEAADEVPEPFSLQPADTSAVAPEDVPADTDASDEATEEL